MTAFPTPFTVRLHSFVAGPDDGYGNVAKTYEPPLDEPGVEYRVVGWADLFLPSAAEVFEHNQNRVISYQQMFVPVDMPVNAPDIVDIAGEKWEVFGAPNMYNSPWWQPGVKAVYLQQITG